MYLAEVVAENFRIYGTQWTTPGAAGDDRLRIELNRGLTVLVGENDSGKSGVVDAIRFCLLTSASDFNRISVDDFHCVDGVRAQTMSIVCKFAGLTDQERGQFLEFLTPGETGDAFLYVNLTANRLEDLGPSRVSVVIRSGMNGEGPTIEGEARELLRATYLRPLRDAEAELRPGRSSRLSQILASYPEILIEDRNDFNIEDDTATTLVGILKRAEHGIANNAAIAAASKEINDDYLSRFRIAKDSLESSIGVVSDTSLRGVLERLELSFTENPRVGERTRRGLGYNNALFMAAELLLLGKTATAPLLLIEEPEAHLHPQLQARVMDLLVEKASNDEMPVQVLLTTHSSNIASAVPVESLTLLVRGKTFSLAQEKTQLDVGDYEFLHRFLDVTKANLFFARGVAIVEGDAEAILIPALAEAVGRSFNDRGISVVNVGHVGLFRYSRIFQRADSVEVPVRVACLRDRDIAPAGTPDDMRKKLKTEADFSPAELLAHVDSLKKRDGGAVKTFVSDSWTLEYDLAAASWESAALMHAAIRCALISKDEWPGADALQAAEYAAIAEVEKWKSEKRDLVSVALDIYRPLRMNNASKAISAQHAARLLSQSGIDRQYLPTYLLAAFDYLAGE